MVSGFRVDHRPHNPSVPGSSPGCPTFLSEPCISTPIGDRSDHRNSRRVDNGKAIFGYESIAKPEFENRINWEEKRRRKSEFTEKLLLYLRNMDKNAAFIKTKRQFYWFHVDQDFARSKNTQERSKLSSFYENDFRKNSPNFKPKSLTQTGHVNLEYFPTIFFLHLSCKRNK